MGADFSRRAMLGTTGTILAVATAGCVGGERDETESVSRTVDVGNASRLTVDGHSEVSVRAEDRRDVAIDAEKRAGSERGLADVSLSIERTEETLALAVERADGLLPVQLGPGPTMGLSVRVPSDLRVAQVATPNGSIGATAVRGDLALEAVNGPVTAADVRGSLDVDGVNGDVVVSGIAGDLVVETTNGAIDAEGVDGDVALATTNGDVTLGLASDLDATVDLRTDNGTVTITGVGDLSGAEEFPVTVGDGRRRIEVETTNGDVTLREND